MEIEQYIEQNSETQNILLMVLIKSFGAVNRTILRAELYKEGIPVQTILHIRRGRNRTTLQAQYNKQYGEKVNNIGSSQGSATSALLFVIYLRDVMGEYSAIRYLENPL